MTTEEINEAVTTALQKEFSLLLARFGLEDDEPKEVRADLAHLRKWRKSVEQAEGLAFKTVITVVITGFLGALWLGFKTIMGK